ncbi:MAG: carboxypeptidase-like regulatory domain-containing protein, partial [Planctomycetota bacterium]
SLTDMGRVAGIVRGPGGDPLRNAAVMLGFHRARTGQDGTFEIRYVPFGDHTLSITRSGYRPLGEKVQVAEGADAEVDVTMEFRESGSVALSGTVTGPAGEPVEKARVYVIAYGAGSAGTVRSAQTDEQGRYAMESLPDRLRKVKVRIQASRMGYQAANEVFEDGMRAGEVNLGLPVKFTRLRLTVLDAASDEPLTRCRFEATKAGADRPYPTISSRSEAGQYETWIAAGTYEFQVEAPDHEAHVAEVTVPEGGADLVYTARLVAVGEKSVEISLTVRVMSAITGDPIEAAKVEILDPTTGEAVSRLESRRPGGIFTMPAPSGRRRIRVTAKDHEVWEEDVDLKPDEAERTVEARLTPR